MSSLGTLINISSGMRKIFPVDVQETDGQFIRGYVQDVFDDGKVLVYFGVGLLETVEPHRLFQARFLTESEGYDQDHDIIFGKGTSVDVLVRIYPGSAARWYPGSVSATEGKKSLVDIYMGDGTIRKGVFGDVFKSTDIQLPLSRAPASFDRLTLALTKEVKLSDIDEDFHVEWEELTRSIIKAVDLEKRLLVVLEDEEVEGKFGPPSSKYLEALLFELRGYGFVQRSDEMMSQSDDGAAESDLDCIPPEWSQEASTALMIPEMLVGALRYLDLKNRHILRGVSRIWRDVMGSVQVCRSAHFDDTLKVGRLSSTSIDENPFLKDIEFCRFFSQLHFDHLTLISVRCANDPDNLSSSYVETLAFVGPLLVPRLKTLVLYDCHVSLPKLIWDVLQMDSAPRILLKNVTLHGPAIAGTTLSSMHIRVKSGMLDRSLIVDDGTDVPDDTTPLTEMEYFVDDNVRKALLSVRKLLMSVLAVIPLGCPEEYILSEIAGISEELFRTDVLRVLEVLDPGCVTPKMYDEAAEIHLAKSSVRNSTLHFLKAILAEYHEVNYRCGDLTCCKKRKRVNL